MKGENTGRCGWRKRRKVGRGGGVGDDGRCRMDVMSEGWIDWVK